MGEPATGELVIVGVKLAQRPAFGFVIEFLDREEFWRELDVLELVGVPGPLPVYGLYLWHHPAFAIGHRTVWQRFSGRSGMKCWQFPQLWPGFLDFAT